MTSPEPVAPEAVSEAGADSAAQAAGRSPRSIATVVAAAACAIAAVAAVVFGYLWLDAAGQQPRADARDAALDGARQVGLNLTTVNPDNPDASLKLIESSVTGDLHDHVTGTAEEYRQTVKQANTVVTSKVLAAALTALNSERDQASAVVVLEETETPKDGRQAQVQQFTWAIDMAKAGDTWKADQAKALGDPVLLGVPGNLYNAQPQNGAQPQQQAQPNQTDAPEPQQPGPSQSAPASQPDQPTTKPGS